MGGGITLIDGATLIDFANAITRLDKVLVLK
jgi:hypothetical protein